MLFPETTTVHLKVKKHLIYGACTASFSNPIHVLVERGEFLLSVFLSGDASSSQNKKKV